MATGKLEKSMPFQSQRITLGSISGASRVNAEIETDADLHPEPLDPAELQTEIDELKATLTKKLQQIDQRDAQLLNLTQESRELEAALDAVHTDLDNLKRSATDEGYRAGEAAARNDMCKQAEASSIALTKGIEELLLRHDDHLNQLKRQLPDIVMASVVKVIGQQLANAKSIAHAIEHVIRESGELGDIKLFLAPRQHEELLSFSDWNRRVICGRKIEVIADPRIQYGGCIIEGMNGVIDGRYEIQLARLRDIVGAITLEEIS